MTLCYHLVGLREGAAETPERSRQQSPAVLLGQRTSCKWPQVVRGRQSSAYPLAPGLTSKAGENGQYSRVESKDHRGRDRRFCTIPATESLDRRKISASKLFTLKENLSMIMVQKCLVLLEKDVTGNLIVANVAQRKPEGHYHEVRPSSPVKII